MYTPGDVDDAVAKLRQLLFDREFNAKVGKVASFVSLLQNLGKQQQWRSKGVLGGRGWGRASKVLSQVLGMETFKKGVQICPLTKPLLQSLQISQGRPVQTHQSIGAIRCQPKGLVLT